MMMSISVMVHVELGSRFVRVECSILVIIHHVSVIVCPLLWVLRTTCIMLRCILYWRSVHWSTLLRNHHRWWLIQDGCGGRSCVHDWWLHHCRWLMKWWRTYNWIATTRWHSSKVRLPEIRSTLCYSIEHFLFINGRQWYVNRSLFLCR